MKSGAWKRWTADIHLWLSLFVGLQLLAWVLSGLVMVSAPIERVRSEHRMAELADPNLSANSGIVAPDQIIASMDVSVRRLSLERIGGQLIYAVEGMDEQKVLFDAQSGQRISPISEALARRIAEDAIAGNERAARLTLIAQSPPIEYRGALPVWRADFTDADNLSVYVEANTGRVSARRSDLWRVYDFMWSLHIMDYGDREHFNHPLLIVVTALALAMTIAGIVLLFIRLPARFRRPSRENSP